MSKRKNKPMRPPGKEHKTPSVEPGEELKELFSNPTRPGDISRHKKEDQQVNETAATSQLLEITDVPEPPEKPNKPRKQELRKPELLRPELRTPQSGKQGSGLAETRRRTKGFKKSESIKVPDALKLPEAPKVPEALKVPETLKSAGPHRVPEVLRLPETTEGPARLRNVSDGLPVAAGLKSIRNAKKEKRLKTIGQALKEMELAVHEEIKRSKGPSPQPKSDKPVSDTIKPVKTRGASRVVHKAGAKLTPTPPQKRSDHPVDITPEQVSEQTMHNIIAHALEDEEVNSIVNKIFSTHSKVKEQAQGGPKNQERESVRENRLKQVKIEAGEDRQEQTQQRIPTKVQEQVKTQEPAKEREPEKDQEQMPEIAPEIEQDQEGQEYLQDTDQEQELYLTMKQVATIVQVELSTIRYWEKEFADYLGPALIRNQRKCFSQDQLEFFTKIKELLKTEQYTIEGAKRRLELDKLLAGSLGVEHNFKNTVFIMFSAIMQELQEARRESRELTGQVAQLRQEKTQVEEQLQEEQSKGLLDFLKTKLNKKGPVGKEV